MVNLTVKTIKGKKFQIDVEQSHTVSLGRSESKFGAIFLGVSSLFFLTGKEQSATCCALSCWCFYNMCNY